MKSSVAIVLALFLAVPASAVTMDMVTVGNAGNAPDMRYASSGFGSVGYAYKIGKYEVTNAQYVEFLNGVDPTAANARGLYSDLMTSNPHGGIIFNRNAAFGLKYEIKPGRGSNPVVFVSWYDAIRFANWLNNGQGNGDTEHGAYILGPLSSGGVPSNGDSIQRNTGAKWCLPSEDEWYKAAYHKNDGLSGNYWDYPTGTNAIPYSDQPPGSDVPDQSNTANFFKNDNVANSYDDGFAVTASASIDRTQNYLTDVGAYALSASAYGTYDQAGNVGEWNETSIFGSFRGFRGGTFSAGYSVLGASERGSLIATGASGSDGSIMGFRVASLAVPEPSTFAVATAASLLFFCLRRPTSYNRV
jgi:formylglycine-generating enzyme required for sulfatase activity